MTTGFQGHFFRPPEILQRIEDAARQDEYLDQLQAKNEVLLAERRRPGALILTL